MSLRQKFIIAIFFFMVLVSGLFFVFFTALYSKALILQENNVSGFGYLITEMIESKLAGVKSSEEAEDVLKGLSDKISYLVDVRVAKENSGIKGRSHDIYIDKYEDGFFVYADIDRTKLPGQIIFNTLEITVLIIVLSILILVWLVYVMVSRFMLRPLEKLEEGVERISRENYSRPVPSYEGKDEISVLITAFNKMMKELREFKTRAEDKLTTMQKEVKQKERQMIIAQRLASAGQLAAGIAHEINNPLGGMLNAAFQLSKQKDLKKKDKEYVELIVEGLQRIRETVRKILRVRFSQHRTEAIPIDVNEAVCKSIAFIQHKLNEKEVKLFKDLDKTGKKITGDFSDIQQAFLNILINAVDAVDKVGKINITTKADDRFVTVEITDNGCGIDNNEMPRIFDLFYSSKISGKGVGLGLSITHNIIRSHNGMIDVTSEKGKGSTFKIKLPIAESE